MFNIVERKSDIVMKPICRWQGGIARERQAPEPGVTYATGREAVLEDMERGVQA